MRIGAGTSYKAAILAAIFATVLTNGPEKRQARIVLQVESTMSKEEAESFDNTVWINAMVSEFGSN